MTTYRIVVRCSTCIETRCVQNFPSPDEAYEYFQENLEPYGFELEDIIENKDEKICDRRHSRSV
jgi:hypothetical protein